MTMMTARVELHGVTNEETYKALHDAMFAAGYALFITGDDGKSYQLPTGTYRNSNSGDTPTEAMQRIVAIATRFQPKLNPPRTPWVLVTAGPAAWQLNPLK